MIDEGKTELDISEESFGTYVKYFKGIREAMKLREPVRDYDTEFTIIIGPPGVGKTTYAMESWPEAYWKSHDQWWDFYDGHSVVVLDEYKGYLPYSLLCRMHDPSPLIVGNKGSTKQFLASSVVIISNYMPWEWYDYEGLHLNKEALFRRCDWIIFYTGVGESQKFRGMDAFRDYCYLNNLGEFRK